MANYFSRYDDQVFGGSGPTELPAANAEGSNHFAQYDTPAGGYEEAPSRGVGRQVGIGANDVIHFGLSALGDATGYGIAKLTGDESWRGAGSRAASRELDVASKPMRALPGVSSDFTWDPKADQNAANTTPEKLAREAGAGAASMLLPEAAAPALAGVFPRAAGALSTAFGDASSMGNMARNAGVGALSGMAGEGAAELAPPGWEGPARIVGGLVGGVGGAIATHPEAAIGAAGNAVRNLRSDADAINARAGEQLVRGGNWESGAAAVRDVEAGQRDMPAWQRETTTLGQTTRNSRIREAEQNAAVHPEFRNDFANMETSGRAAQAREFGNVQTTGDPNAVIGGVRRAMQDLEDTHVATLRNQRGAFDEQAAGVRAGKPEDIGDALQGHLNDAFEAFKQGSRNLWQAIDPHGNIGVYTSSLRDAAQRIYGSLTPTATELGMQPIEQRVLGVLGNYGDMISLKELGDLRSELGSQITTLRAGNGFTHNAATRRLSQLRGAIDNAIDDTISNRVRQEAGDVAAGRLATQDTMESRLVREIEQWRQQRSASGSPPQGVAGRPPGAGGPQMVPPASGAESQARPGTAAGNSGVPNPNFQPIDKATRARLDQALEHTRQEKRTFVDKGPISSAIQQTQNGVYRMRASQVPGTLWKEGPTGYETAQAYLKAAPSDEARQALTDAAHASFRDEVMPRGEVIPGAFAKWQKKYAGALRALPEVNRHLNSVAGAGETVANTARSGEAFLKEASKGTAAKILASDSAEEVKGHVGRLLEGGATSLPEIRKLKNMLGGRPDALEGMKRAAADYLKDKLTSVITTPKGDPMLNQGQTIKALRKMEPALRELGYSDEQIRNLRSIANHMERTSWIVRTGRGSNTTQDILPHLSKMTGGERGLSWLDHFFLGREAWERGGVFGLGAYAGGNVLKKAVGNRLVANADRVDRLVVEAMLDPDLAKQLMRKVPPQAKQQDQRLSQLLRRVSTYSLSSPARHGEDEQ